MAHRTDNRVKSYTWPSGDDETIYTIDLECSGFEPVLMQVLTDKVYLSYRNTGDKIELPAGTRLFYDLNNLFNTEFTLSQDASNGDIPTVSFMITGSIQNTLR